MHIGFLTSEYPHPQTGNGGGIGTSIKNLAIALLELGCKVSVFVYAKEATISIDDNGIKVHTLAYHQSKFATWYFYRKSIERWLNEHIIADGVDVLEVPDWTGATAFMKLKCPVVMKFHGSDTYFCHIEGRKLKLKNRMFEYLAAKNADAYVGVSEFALNLSAKLLKIGRDKPKKVIYNGIDIESFNYFNDRNNDPVLLYLGTLIRKKGVLELPAIFNLVVEKVPNAKLILVGGDSFDIYTGSSSTYDLMKGMFTSQAMKNVQYLGKLPYNELPEIFNRVMVAIFPSFAETFGLVVIESMAKGVPCVTSDKEWFKEIVTDGVSGFMSSPKEHDIFSDRIVDLIKSPELRKSISVAARQRVELFFSSTRCAEQTVEFYKQVMKC